ncbi:MAG TPA: hypothetical protein VFP84_33150 [Kofleriaceae bacterium]|nr:hypothetical protein [Kofleriaceae bacterium]
MIDDDSSVPDADAEPTPAELAHARRFAEVVDKTLLGRPPAAMSADDRALLEVATVIRAVHGNAELAAPARRSIVEDALRQAIGSASSSPSVVVPIARARARRWLPWSVAGATSLVAAAALAVLWLRPPAPVHEARLPDDQRSRSADALVGPIARERAGDASARIDEIFADRLDGFRARRLQGGKR